MQLKELLAQMVFSSVDYTQRSALAKIVRLTSAVIEGRIRDAWHVKSLNVCRVAKKALLVASLIRELPKSHWLEDRERNKRSWNMENTQKNGKIWSQYSLGIRMGCFFWIKENNCWIILRVRQIIASCRCSCAALAGQCRWKRSPGCTVQLVDYYRLAIRFFWGIYIYIYIS